MTNDKCDFCGKEADLYQCQHGDWCEDCRDHHELTHEMLWKVSELIQEQATEIRRGWYRQANKGDLLVDFVGKENAKHKLALDEIEREA